MNDGSSSADSKHDVLRVNADGTRVVRNRATDEIYVVRQHEPELMYCSGDLTYEIVPEVVQTDLHASAHRADGQGSGASDHLVIDKAGRDSWRIGRATMYRHVKHRAGLPHLAELVRNPGKSLFAWDLDQLPRSTAVLRLAQDMDRDARPVSHVIREGVVDRETLDLCRERLGALDAGEPEAEADESARLRDFMGRLYRPDGKPREATDEAKRSEDRVRKRIERAIDGLRDDSSTMRRDDEQGADFLVEVAGHLEEHIESVAWAVWRYQP